MVDNRGIALPYTGGTTGRPIPIHDPAQPHTPRPTTAKKPTGLDWDAHTPTCKMCDQRSGRIDGTGLCPLCRGVALGNLPKTADKVAYSVLDEHELVEKFSAPTSIPPTTIPSPAADTAAALPAQRPLEKTLPLDAAGEAHRGEPSPSPGDTPTVRAKVRQTSADDICITLRGHSIATRTTEIAALLSDLLTALNQTPAVAASPARKPANRQPATAGTHVTTDPRTGADGDTRPSAGTRKGKPARRTATQRKTPRPSKIAPHHQDVIDAYAAGDTPTTIGARIGVTGSGIRLYLKAHGVQLRNHRAAAHNRNTTTSTGDTPA